ncbi:MAG: HGGxSTG domain-containing protein [Alphaproteobacteria bacterium]|nr:HGGxSTG domain-containing protein [Alphaproteobacteria bacterium]
MHQCQRCLAKTRKGSPCQSPAMPNGRCRMHGGKSTGAPKGNKNALKHGVFTTGTIKQRKELSTLIQNSRRILNEEV